MVRPVIEYISSVFSPCQQANIDKLEKVQKSVARFVLKKPVIHDDNASVTQMVKSLGWEMLKEWRNKNRVTVLYKILNDKLAVPPNYHPQPANTITRSGAHTLLPYQTFVNAYKHSFFPRTVQLWNSLPQHVAASPSLEEFKIQVQHSPPVTPRSRY